MIKINFKYLNFILR